jgi:hypothetical protein
METKFCIEVKNGHLKVDIQGKAGDLRSILSTVCSEDENIKKLLMDSLVIVILDKMTGTSNDPLEDMLNLMHIKLPGEK